MPRDDLDQAISLLVEQGVTSPSLGISAIRAATAAGVTRSTIYRHWPSVDSLNDDLAWRIVRDSLGWQRRLLATPPRADVAGAIAAAIRDDADEWGVQVRAAVTPWAATASAPPLVAEWERDVLDELAAWFDACVQRQGRSWTGEEGPEQCALTTNALVEGAFIVVAYGCPEGRLRLDAELASTLGAAVGHLVADRTAPVEGSGRRRHRARPTPDVPPEPVARRAGGASSTSGADAILDRIVADLVTQEFGACSLIEPGRIIDASRLVRRLDLSERGLYERWPGTPSFNAALTDRIVTQLRACIDQLIQEAMELLLAEPVRERSLTLDPLDRCVRLGSESVGRSLFVTSVAIADPTVRSVTVPFIDAWRASVRTGYLAFLALGHAQVRPPITPLRYGDLHMMAIAGSWRMACTHPSLLQRTVDTDGTTVTPLAAGVHRLSNASSRPVTAADA